VESEGAYRPAGSLMQNWNPPTASLVPLGGNACDFCNTCPAITLFPCGNFSLNSLPVFGKQVGSFAACQKCAELVDANEWSALTERSFQKFMRHHSVARHSTLEVRMQFAHMIKMFAAHRLIEA
jgi:hypothetical protein